MLQMDIEGAEYRNMLATADDTLAGSDDRAEVNRLSNLLDPVTMREVIAPFFAQD